MNDTITKDEAQVLAVWYGAYMMAVANKESNARLAQCARYLLEAQQRTGIELLSQGVLDASILIAKIDEDMK